MQPTLIPNNYKTEPQRLIDNIQNGDFSSKYLEVEFARWVWPK